MPSKARNGNAPLGADKLQIGKLDAASGFARTEDQLLRRTPVEPTNTGWINAPNGIIHQPKRFLRGRGAGGGEWKVSLSLDEGVYTARVAEGKIYAGLLDPERITFETTEGEPNYEDFETPVDANDVVCIKYTYTTTEPAVDAFVTIEAFAGGEGFVDFEPTEDDGADPPEIIATRYPLAKIIDTGEVDGDDNPILAVEQMATNNLAKVITCINGTGIETFTPI